MAASSFLVSTLVCQELASAWPAKARASFSNASSSTSISTSPSLAASSASIGWAPNISRLAWLIPIRRGRRCVMPQAPTRPHLPWVSANRADRAAMITSAASASSNPPVKHTPCTAAITGCGSFASRAITPSLKRLSVKPAPIPPISAPAQNARPFALTRTQPMESVCRSSVAQWASSSSKVAVSSALSLSGRFRVSVQSPSRSSRKTRSVIRPFPSLTVPNSYRKAAMRQGRWPREQSLMAGTILSLPDFLCRTAQWLFSS